MSSQECQNFPVNAYQRRMFAALIGILWAFLPGEFAYADNIKIDALSKEIQALDYSYHKPAELGKALDKHLQSGLDEIQSVLAQFYCDKGAFDPPPEVVKLKCNEARLGVLTDGFIHWNAQASSQATANTFCLSNDASLAGHKPSGGGTFGSEIVVRLIPKGSSTGGGVCFRASPDKVYRFTSNAEIKDHEDNPAMQISIWTQRATALYEPYQTLAKNAVQAELRRRTSAFVYEVWKEFVPIQVHNRQVDQQQGLLERLRVVREKLNPLKSAPQPEKQEKPKLTAQEAALKTQYDSVVSDSESGKIDWAQLCEKFPSELTRRINSLKLLGPVTEFSDVALGKIRCDLLVEKGPGRLRLATYLSEVSDASLGVLQPMVLSEELKLKPEDYQHALRLTASSYQPDPQRLPWLFFDATVPITTKKHGQPLELSAGSGRSSKTSEFRGETSVVWFGRNLERASKRQLPGIELPAGTLAGPFESKGDQIGLVAREAIRYSAVQETIEMLFLLSVKALTVLPSSSGSASSITDQEIRCKNALQASLKDLEQASKAQALELDLHFSTARYTARAGLQKLQPGDAGEGQEWEIITCRHSDTCDATTPSDHITARRSILIYRRHRVVSLLTELSYQISVYPRNTSSNPARSVPLGGYKFEQVGGFGGPDQIYELRGNYGVENSFALAALVAFYPGALCDSHSIRHRKAERLAIATGPSFLVGKTGEFIKQWNLRLGYEIPRTKTLLTIGAAVRRSDVPVYLEEGTRVTGTSVPDFAKREETLVLFTAGLALDLAITADLWKAITDRVNQKNSNSSTGANQK